jgi:hypothetical protein
LRLTAKFLRDPSRPIQRGSARAITQDVSLKGVQFLCSAIPEETRSFDVWLFCDELHVLHGKARVAWKNVEGELADGPFWLRVGCSLTFERAEDREELANLLADKLGMEGVSRLEATTKIGYLF